MSNDSLIQATYAGRWRSPQHLADIPNGRYMVYILLHNDQAVVVGLGKRNRARVILDTLDAGPTTGHIKAMKVRITQICAHANDTFCRYIILCDNREQAASIEQALHRQMGGNVAQIEPALMQQVLAGVMPTSALFLQMAAISAFDGISDLRRWRSAGLIHDAEWHEISARLRL